ncbi:MAG: DUF58 domain-containing protein [Planctomycetota bacterium]
MLKKLAYILQTDFCPGANVYVYWLKEPVGWFVVALACSVLIGIYFSPVGWSIAAGLAAVLLLGLGFPWVATRLLRCELRCDVTELHEGEEAKLILSIRNPMPLPVLGVVIENYFRSADALLNTNEQLASSFECGLARVPAFSSAEYRLPIQPKYRGRYPTGEPSIACGFPFGIYTARRPVAEVTPVLVRPLILPLTGESEFSGKQLAEVGDGSRPTHHGDFLGVREFRRGDSLRSIHWVQSAKQDQLVVCERGGPQKCTVTIELSTTRSEGGDLDARENLAWRVRIAATLVDLLSARHIPFRLRIDGELLALPLGRSAAIKGWDLLAEIPLDSPKHNDDVELMAASNEPGFSILPASAGSHASDRYVRIYVRLGDQAGSTGEPASGLIDLDEPIDEQLDLLLEEANRDFAA